MNDKKKPASAGFFYGHAARLSGVNTDFALNMWGSVYICTI